MKHPTETNAEAAKTIEAFFHAGGPYDDVRHLLSFPEKRRPGILDEVKKISQYIHDRVEQDLRDVRTGKIVLKND